MRKPQIWIPRIEYYLTFDHSFSYSLSISTLLNLGIVHEVHGDVLVKRPLLVAQIPKVGVLASDGVLAPVPTTHAGVQSLPAAEALHLDVSSVTVNSIASLVQEVFVILYRERSDEKIVG